MDNSVCLPLILLPGMDLVDDLLVEPGRKLSIEFIFERFPEEAFRI